MILSHYIHIPFCHRKCPYCHFYVLPNDPRFHELLMEGLRLEFQKLPSYQKSPYTLYFGGGTPALLGPKYVSELIELSGASDKIEITLEMNPEDVTEELIREYKACGINRISLGTQSFSEDDLHQLGRKHRPSEAARAIHTINLVGIHNISIDIMYDVPNQSVRAFKESFQIALELPITHLSLYNLTIEPHTVFYKKRDQLPALDETASLEKLNFAIDHCERMGLKRYEISAFGEVSQHNIGYWEGRAFLGFGPSSWSFFENERFQNIPNIWRYVKRLREGKSPVSFREKLKKEALSDELLALRLRLIKGLPLVEVTHEQMKKLEPFHTYLNIENERLSLTKSGLLYHDSIASALQGEN